MASIEKYQLIWDSNENCHLCKKTCSLRWCILFSEIPIIFQDNWERVVAEMQGIPRSDVMPSKLILELGTAICYQGFILVYLCIVVSSISSSHFFIFSFL